MKKEKGERKGRRKGWKRGREGKSKGKIEGKKGREGGRKEGRKQRKEEGGREGERETLTEKIEVKLTLPPILHSSHSPLQIMSLRKQFTSSFPSSFLPQNKLTILASFLFDIIYPQVYSLKQKTKSTDELS